MKFIIMFLLCILFILNSCSKDDNNVVQPSFAADSVYKIDFNKLKITGKVTLNSGGKNIVLFLWTWFRYSDSLYENHSWLCSSNDDGFYLWGGISQKDTFLLEKTLQYKYPIKLNEQWENKICSYVASDSSFEIKQSRITKCIATDESVTVPAGTFKAIVYQDITNPLSNTKTLYYLVPEIGLVMINVTDDGKPSQKRVLIDYYMSK
jgi:hypothetical protein